MARFDERCEFRSIRSRWTGWLVGLLALIYAGALGIEILAKQSRQPTGAVVVAIVLVLCTVGVGLLLNALRSGHLTLTPERLVYHSVFRNREFSRSHVREARAGTFSPWNNWRVFSVPFLVCADGRSIRLTDFNSPVRSDLPTIDARVWRDGNEERSTETLDGLVEWINSWVSYEDWINDSTSQASDSP